MILSQVTLVCLAALVLGGNRYNSDSGFNNNCGDECPETCLCLCKQATGECIEGCVPGYYGYNCNKTCDPHCRINYCLQYGGHCACELGYLYLNSRCEKDAGKQCRMHFGCRNDRCSSTGDEECLEGCKPGLFGTSCDSPCGDNCFCDQESGKCTDCVHGWFGPECQSQCSSGCTEGCYKNGSCIDRCKPGSYGEQCDIPCSHHCVSGCDQLSGECVQCEAGRYGPTCQSECSAWCVGCERGGSCIRGCVKGYYGETCVSTCPQQCNEGLCHRNGSCIRGCMMGYYGEKCDSTCPQQCSDGLCHRNGSCIKGCVKGYYGKMCNSICPRQCRDGLCDLNGSCINGCVKGYYGQKCESTCHVQCDEGLCDLNGRCTSCRTGFYGPGCSKICEECAEGHCDRDKGECNDKSEDSKEHSDINFSWIAGGVTFFIIGAVFMVYISYRLKRIDDRINYSAEWRRSPPAVVDELRAVASPHVVPDRSDVDEERANISPPVCPILRHRPATYVEPFHGVGNPVQPQQQAISDFGQQTAAASSENLQPSDGLVNQAAALTYMGEASSRPDSYVIPNYCEINEDLIATHHQLQRTQQSHTHLSDRLSEPSDDRNATGGVINIPLIAECSWNTETEDSTPDKDSRPDDENYDHPFKDYCACTSKRFLKD